MTAYKDPEGYRQRAHQRFVRALVALLRPLILEDIGATQRVTDGEEALSTTCDII